MKILIADDEIDILLLIRERLIKQGHNVDIALDGGKALELIERNSYDLTFLDHNMPDMTGLELIKYIKKKNLKTKTVMITGYSHIVDSLAKRVGADEYMAKPLKLKEVEGVVNKYK